MIRLERHDLDLIQGYIGAYDNTENRRRWPACQEDQPVKDLCPKGKPCYMHTPSLPVDNGSQTGYSVMLS